MISGHLMKQQRCMSGGLAVDQGWVQLHKITSITITLKYKFQLQLQITPP